jgi:hypothetical protein
MAAWVAGAAAVRSAMFTAAGGVFTAARRRGGYDSGERRLVEDGVAGHGADSAGGGR